MFSIVLIILAILLIYILLKVYFEKYDNAVAYTGGLGSGKTFRAVVLSCKLLKRNRCRFYFENFKIWLKNMFKKKTKKLEYLKEKPMLYSNIPIFIKQKHSKFKTYNVVELKQAIIINDKPIKFLTRKQVEDLNIDKREIKRYIESSIELTEDYLLLQKRLNYKSVTLIDEFGSYVNQYEYNNPNAIYTLDEFVRLYRQYTKGGYLIVTEQCSDSICKPIRVRLNKIFNLMNFRNYLNLFYSVNIREMSISEDIKTIESENAEDNMKTTFGVFPLKKKYDTFCYSVRYDAVPSETEWQYYTSLKKYKLMKISKKLVKPLTSNGECDRK